MESMQKIATSTLPPRCREKDWLVAPKTPPEVKPKRTIKIKISEVQCIFFVVFFNSQQCPTQTNVPFNDSQLEPQTESSSSHVAEIVELGQRFIFCFGIGTQLTTGCMLQSKQKVLSIFQPRKSRKYTNFQYTGKWPRSGSVFNFDFYFLPRNFFNFDFWELESITERF